MTTRAAKISLCVSTLFGLAVAASILGARRHQHYQVVDKRAEVESLLLARQLEPRGLSAVVPGLKNGSRLERIPIDRAMAESLFSSDETLVYDPLTVYRYASNLRQTMPFPEYPGGHYLRITNSSGEREDHDTFAEKPDLFVIVAGDSHTDGVCDSGETFPNLLEVALRRARPGKIVEVLNAGVAGYGPYQYLGVLEKYLAHAPQLFVLAFYGGNDFIDVLHLRHFFDHTLAPKPSHDSWNEMEREKKISRAALLQGIEQMMLFRRCPEEAALALETCDQVNAEIARLCDEHGLPWIFVYIPSVFDGPWPEQGELRAHCRRVLELSDWDLDVDNRLADAMLASLRRRGVDVLDLRPVFASESGPWYWSDLHIDLRAQARIAEHLLPRAEAVLARTDVLLRSGALLPRSGTPLPRRSAERGAASELR